MKLIVGLGNPGGKYEKNRHNVGFLLLDQLAESLGVTFKKKINYYYASYKDVLLLKPRTYMNRSGKAVASAKTSFRIDEILVVVDDIYLEMGDIRMRRKGGFGGHNGLKSIGAELGSQEFGRFRIGVGEPGQQDLANFVLSNFSSKDMKDLKHTLDYSEELLEKYIKYDFDRMIDHYSRTKKSYSERLTSQDLTRKKEENA